MATPRCWQCSWILPNPQSGAARQPLPHFLSLPVRMINNHTYDHHRHYIMKCIIIKSLSLSHSLLSPMSSLVLVQPILAMFPNDALVKLFSSNDMPHMYAYIRPDIHTHQSQPPPCNVLSLCATICLSRALNCSSLSFCCRDATLDPLLCRLACLLRYFLPARTVS